MIVRGASDFAYKVIPQEKFCLIIFQIGRVYKWVVASRANGVSFLDIEV